MASIYYAKRGVAYAHPILLFAQSDGEWLASPTIAAGDFQVSTYTDAGVNETGATNLTNLPAVSPASSGVVPLILTAAEMNHDIVVVTWKDAAGAEWQSGGIVIMTTPHALPEAALEASLTTIDANVDAILLDTGTDGVLVAGDLSATMKASVNAEVVDVLTVDTYAEPVAVPAATSSLKDKLNWLFALARNKMMQTATTQTLRNDADGADIATSATSDSAGTFTRGEWS